MKRYYGLTSLLYHRHSIGVQELSVPFTAFTKLKLKPSFAVKDLNAVIVCVGNNDVSLSVHSNATRLGELAYNRKW